MLHDGVIRRSDEEFGELMRSGTSAAAWRDMSARARAEKGQVLVSEKLVNKADLDQKKGQRRCGCW